jgi:hypothetical protein
MKHLILIILSIVCFSSVNAQINVDLSGKKFEQINKIPNSTTHLYFKSNNEAVYIMSGSLMSGKTYRDECSCKVTIQKEEISINCLCNDREMYPDPIKDSFIYDPATNSLKSTTWSDRNRNPFIWKSIN